MRLMILQCRIIDERKTPEREMFANVISYLFQLPDYYFDKKKAKAEDALKRKLKNIIKKGKSVVAPMNEGIELVRRGGNSIDTLLRFVNLALLTLGNE